MQPLQLAEFPEEILCHILEPSDPLTLFLASMVCRRFASIATARLKKIKVSICLARLDYRTPLAHLTSNLSLFSWGLAAGYRITEETVRAAVRSRPVLQHLLETLKSNTAASAHSAVAITPALLEIAAVAAASDLRISSCRYLKETWNTSYTATIRDPAVRRALKRVPSLLTLRKLVEEEYLYLTPSEKALSEVLIPSEHPVTLATDNEDIIRYLVQQDQVWSLPIAATRVPLTEAYVPVIWQDLCTDTQRTRLIDHWQLPSSSCSFFLDRGDYRWYTKLASQFADESIERENTHPWCPFRYAARKGDLGRLTWIYEQGWRPQIGPGLWDNEYTRSESVALWALEHGIDAEKLLFNSLANLKGETSTLPDAIVEQSLVPYPNNVCELVISSQIKDPLAWLTERSIALHPHCGDFIAWTRDVETLILSADRCSLSDEFPESVIGEAYIAGLQTYYRPTPRLLRHVLALGKWKGLPTEIIEEQDAETLDVIASSRPFGRLDRLEITKASAKSPEDSAVAWIAREAKARDAVYEMLMAAATRWQCDSTTECHRYAAYLRTGTSELPTARVEELDRALAALSS